MRYTVLLALLPIASAEVDPAEVLGGEWGFRLFAQLDTVGAWSDAAAGAMARFERVDHNILAPDPSGSSGLGGGKKRGPRVSQDEIRVVKRTEEHLVVRIRDRPSNEDGELGAWKKARTFEWRLSEPTDWRVERIEDTTCSVGPRSVAATTYRVRFRLDQFEQGWTVVAAAGLGVLQATQEHGSKRQWRLVNVDAECALKGRKLACREYVFRWEDPPEFGEPLIPPERRMFLSAKVPGRVARRVYAGILGKRVEENLIAFQGR